MNSTLEALLKRPESKTLGFKRDLSSPRNVLKTLVAYANSAGGQLDYRREQVGEQVSEQVIFLLRQCENEPKSKQELLQALELSNAYMNYKRHIVPLLEQQLLALTIPDKPRSRLQRYRLTNNGQSILSAYRHDEN